MNAVVVCTYSCMLRKALEIRGFATYNPNEAAPEPLPKNAPHHAPQSSKKCIKSAPT